MLQRCLDAEQMEVDYPTVVFVWLCVALMLCCQLTRIPVSGSVCIEGATGDYTASKKANGIFEPTDEMRDGLPVYRKKGDGTTWLLFDRASVKWYIQSPRDLTSAASRAFCKVDTICLPHDCPLGMWQIFGQSFENQPSVTIGNKLDITMWSTNAYFSSFVAFFGRATCFTEFGWFPWLLKYTKSFIELYQTRWSAYVSLSYNH